MPVIYCLDFKSFVSQTLLTCVSNYTVKQLNLFENSIVKKIVFFIYITYNIYSFIVTIISILSFLNVFSNKTRLK